MIISLKNRALIQITGEDSEDFLQSQFSNDVKKIQDRRIQINAYCQHQGKIIAIIWLFKRDKKYYLSIPYELKDIVLSKLNMFKLMSRVEIKDYSEIIYQYGLIAEDNEETIRIIDNLTLLTTREPIKEDYDYPYWENACINATLPEIYINLSEKFTPQALNLDIDQMGVSFTKGCYPGQEVVARMHYLGKPKRRLFLFSSKCEATIGDSINVESSKSLKPSGTILRVAKIDENYYSLGTFEIQHINESANLNNDVNKSLIIVNAK